MMDVAWRLRLLILAALVLITFGDFYSFGHKDEKSNTNQAGATAPNDNKLQPNDGQIDLRDDNNLNELSNSLALKQKHNLLKLQMTDAIKESCLPKMLCEMAAKPEYMLNEKEKELMQLIRSSTMSLAMNGRPSKWHFAAHMGELLRYTGDEMSGPMGCANLWPNCPISSKKLTKLSYKVKL